ncbi:hypothetical protein IGI04_007414, partial [Brassica rapa subsp. trilocularis]
ILSSEFAAASWYSRYPIVCMDEYYCREEAFTSGHQKQSAFRTQLDRSCQGPNSTPKDDPQFSGMGWVWKDTMGKIQLMGSRNLRRRQTALHSELEALQWAMDNML